MAKRKKKMVPVMELGVPVVDIDYDVPEERDDAFLVTPLSCFGENMHVEIKDNMVHRISEDSGLLCFVHMINETDPLEIAWMDRETLLPPHMYKLSLMSLAMNTNLEFSLTSQSPQQWIPNNANVRADIIAKLSTGMSLLEICALPKYPPLRVLQSWMRRDTAFALAIQETLTSLGQVMHDLALKEAKAASDADPKSSKALIEALKWSAMVANPERFNPAKKEDIQLPTQWNVIIHTGIPSPQPITIDVTPTQPKKEIT